MLNFISWQQYLTAAAILFLAWYAYVGLRYYRTELSFLFGSQRSPENHPSLITHRQASVMGAAQADIDATLHHPEELLFGASDPDNISDATVPPGPADELLAEAEMLIEAFHESDDKPGFLSLLNILIGKYAAYSEEIDLESVLILLKDRAITQLHFHLTNNEWPVAWPEA
ncbi:MAG TPA: hypothetical protein VNW95_09475 [Mucilaginibacter sp.]|nr:hypothetical protein [Mucilaginibacter sp.]